MMRESDRIEQVLRNLEQAKPTIRVGDMAYMRPERQVRDFRDTDDPRDAVKVLGKDLIKYSQGV